MTSPCEDCRREFILKNQEGKGLCVGTHEARKEAYPKDVVWICSFITGEPTEPKVMWNGSMTPLEAINLGIALIRCSTWGEELIKKLEEEQKDGNKESNTGT